jgi:hypothetical protein
MKAPKLRSPYASALFANESYLTGIISLTTLFATVRAFAMSDEETP